MADLDQILAIRSFNRFFTERIGVLEERLVGSDFTLTEARALFEIGAGNIRTARALGNALGVDKGYLSRVIGRLERSGVIARTPSTDDRRERNLSMTDRGRLVFDRLQADTNAQIEQLVGNLSPAEVSALVENMTSIQHLLSLNQPGQSDAVIRPFAAGDLGWIVERHGALYWQEYGWDIRFEGLVAGIVSDFVTNFVPARERCWIAEYDGRRAGCIMCVRLNDDVAKLRLLLVEPWARGIGLGKRLVRTCIDFARAAGCRELVLWTNDVLVEARALYQKAGFVLVESEPQPNFGKDLIAETWQLNLVGTDHAVSDSVPTQIKTNQTI
jgi:DNA-binding MarR family transcriptional regulator/N-acetylglutamate synthase-like GNAT family acetyltransferase